MTINNFTFFSPTGTEFPVSSNADAKLYTMLTGMELNTFRRKDWSEPIDTALNRQYTNTSLVVGGRYFELEGESVELQPSSDNFVHANIDLTNTSAPVSISVEASDNSNATDINNGTGVLKQCFDIVTTDSMGVTAQQVPKQVTVLNELTVDKIDRTSDIPWTNLGAGSRYKKVGTRVTIDFDYTPATNANFNLGTLPEGCRPSKRYMFIVAGWAGSASVNVHVQVEANGSTTMLAPTAKQLYRWQISFEI